MHRRCNYDKESIEKFRQLCNSVLSTNSNVISKEATRVFSIYSETRLTDLSMINLFIKDPTLISNTNVPSGLIDSLINQCQSVLKHEPFELLVNHDESI